MDQRDAAQARAVRLPDKTEDALASRLFTHTVQIERIVGTELPAPQIQQHLSLHADA